MRASPCHLCALRAGRLPDVFASGDEYEYRISHADWAGESYIFINVDSRDGKVLSSDL